MPGWPLPTFWTASMAKTRQVSTARRSRSVQQIGGVDGSDGGVGGGQGSIGHEATHDVKVDTTGWLRASAVHRAIRRVRRTSSSLPGYSGWQCAGQGAPNGLSPHEEVSVTAVDAGTAALAVPRNRASWRATTRAYIALTKPRIIELLLVTTVPTMFLAAGGVPGKWLVLATFVGGSLGGRRANALNCYLDRDIDQIMRRTGHRPLATAEVSRARCVGLRAGARPCCRSRSWPCGSTCSRRR